MQTASDPDNFKDVEVAQYVGEAIHCAKGAAICADSSRPVDDLLPTEPGGYHGYQALFGAKYIAPAIGGGPNHFSDSGYRVTDSNGNLVDLDGHTIAEPFTRDAGLLGLQPDGDAEPRGARRHAGGRDPGHLRLHLRPAREEGRHARRLHHDRERGDRRQAGRPRRLVLRHERAALRPGVPDVLPAAPGRRDHAGEHAVRDQLGGERPVRRCERRAGDPAHAGRLRRSQHAVQLPVRQRSASCRRTSRPCSRAVRARARSSTSSRRARRSTCTATRRPTTPPSASSNATRRR